MKGAAPPTTTRAGHLQLDEGGRACWQTLHYAGGVNDPFPVRLSRTALHMEAGHGSDPRPELAVA